MELECRVLGVGLSGGIVNFTTNEAVRLTLMKSPLKSNRSSAYRTTRSWRSLFKSAHMTYRNGLYEVSLNT